MVMQSGFSSPRREMFPAGLRVLVVDDDLAWLKILEKMLKKCSYEVTTCTLAREALKLLRERKDGFDIVISDVNMPDMDGFKLLEHVGLEMDLPVIMMSVDGETSRVMKGVQHGACDYLLKPIRMKELKNIWQHVVRKRMHDVREIEGFEERNGTDHNNGHYGGDQTFLKKRKDIESKHDEKGSSDPSAKKARVVWTVELHQKFVKAVNQIGIDSDKVGPKKILDLMDVPWLTRENVASHLQKYRLYLSRIRKEGETDSSFEGLKNTDNSPKESTGSFNLPDSNFAQHSDISSSCNHPGNQFKPVDSKPIDTDLRGSDILPSTVNRKAFNSEVTDPDKASDPQAGLSPGFRSLDAGINYLPFDSPVATQYSWTAQARELHFEPDFKPDSNSEGCFNFEQPSVSVMPQHIQADFIEPPPSIAPEPSISETNNIALTDVKPISGKVSGNDVRQLSPIERVLLSFCAPDPEPFGGVFDMKHQSFTNESGGTKDEDPLQSSIEPLNLYPKDQIPNSQGLGPDFHFALDMKSQISCQVSMIDQSSIFGSESTSGLTMGLPGGDLMCYWPQSDGWPTKDFGFDYMFSDFKFTEHISEAPAPPCAPKFGLDYEHPFDCVEFPPDQASARV